MSEDASPTPVGDPDSESSSTDSENEAGPPVELLVSGRAKRATAGNRLSSLLEKEGDDDLELLFAENEEEEDVEFEDEGENASDPELDSSSDEEDKVPAKGEDDLAGEKELQKQDRLERQKKRKAKEVFKRPGALRKRVKIDSSASPHTPATKPKKKSERVSWVHTEADAPTRASTRKQTVQNREVVFQRLVESEQTRMKVIQHMEEAQKRKDAAKPKALTQADRMEEAAKTEKKNAKSLNRWEESEKKRAEEQRAKLEALHNRQLSGPVITWWSGLARWVNGKIAQLGVKAIRDAGFVEKPTAKTAKENTELRSENKKLAAGTPNAVEDLDTGIPEVLHPHHLTEPSGQVNLSSHRQTSIPQQYTFAPPQSPYGFLDGIHAYAAMPMHQQQAEFTGTADGDSHFPIQPGPGPQGFYNFSRAPPGPARDLTPEIEFATRTLIALKEIDTNAVKLPELQNNVLLKKPRAKGSAAKVNSSSKPNSELCAITMQPARFRDPKTGLAYANSYAYKEIQRLRMGGARWSNLLGCYVGPTNSAARGVPERFWKKG
ncbi:hypothetical protein ACLMJK_005056 [Lecanora helva]